MIALSAVSLLLCSPVSVAQVPQAEREALIALYTSTSGESWYFNNGWLGPVGSECTWEGVSCNSSHVTGLELDGNNLDGRIPQQIGDLPGLGQLRLASNHLRDAIPSQVGSLSNLWALDLASNELTGGIPSEIGSLSQLRTLDLAGNQLSGPIPPDLGNLTQLRKLYLELNHLSGEVPGELGLGTSLLFLNVASNRLTGKIPASLTQLLGLNPLVTGFGYNALWSDDPEVRTFLDEKDPDWEETQTMQPTGLTATSVGDRTVWLEWTPIPYTADEGWYQVYSEQLTRSVPILKGLTTDKAVSTFPVTDIEPYNAYYLSVGGHTEAHANNDNALTSERSEPVFVITGDGGCATPKIQITSTPPGFTLSVASVHDTYEWITGETTQSIVVDPGETTWYWVRAWGPGACDEAAAVYMRTDLFADGFESGDPWAWSEVTPPGGPVGFASGLVSCWNLDDGPGSGVATDQHGTNDGLLVAMDPASDWVAGKFGTALAFDGIDDYVDFGHDASLGTPTGLTVSAWLRIADNAGIRVALSKNLGLDNSSWQLIAAHDANLYDPDAPHAAVTLDTGSGGEAMIADLPAAPPLNTWAHLAMTYHVGDGTLRMYLNGAEEATASDPLLRTLRLSTADLVAGAKSDLSKYYEGRIDDVAIWNRALTADEIAQIWDGGGGKPISELLAE